MKRKMAFYPIQDSTPTPFPVRPLAYPRAWTTENLKITDYLFPIPEDCLEELGHCVASLRAHPIHLYP